MKYFGWALKWVFVHCLWGQTLFPLMPQGSTVVGTVFDNNNDTVGYATIELTTLPTTSLKKVCRTKADEFGQFRLSIPSHRQIQLWGWAYKAGGFLPKHPVRISLHGTNAKGEIIPTFKNLYVHKGTYQVLSFKRVGMRAGIRPSLNRHSDLLLPFANRDWASYLYPRAEKNRAVRVPGLRLGYDINSHRQIVGENAKREPILVHNGRVIPLALPKEGRTYRGWAYSIAESGQIVGAGYPVGKKHRGLYWSSPTSLPLDLNPYFNAHLLDPSAEYTVVPESICNSQRNSGHSWVVGQLNQSRAFRIDMTKHDGPIIDMIGPPRVPSGAYDVQRDGTTSGHVNYHAAVFDAVGFKNLGISNQRSRILKLNQNGSGVGWSLSKHGYTARVWSSYHKGGLSIPLSYLVGPTFNTKFTEAISLNEDGKILVVGKTNNANAHFLLIPPRDYQGLTSR